MGKLCNNDNMVIFDKTSVKTIAHNQGIVNIIKAQPIILEEKRNYTDRLWDTNISPELFSLRGSLPKTTFL